MFVPESTLSTQKIISSINISECQTQLSECRENLEQLEGFQNQELSKVKHMLLSRETALDKETKERVRLQEELKAMASKAGSEEEDKIRQLKAENEKLKVR